ncbi:zeta toxin family protein [Williamsia phyllosphaerae]|uniref:UDP-N-acetylglucosamine kinase n=1 Tax=Williamsia phyllosphaerae TaxID=885042 RepID=A0ABQ1V2E3_9NOCA|nr:zeta toxin family protein [Williamsia phyllosphaerae]GGF35767.1 hypothetical protein GCM10007298_34480 [Williamsia phyllosphaerae]
MTSDPVLHLIVGPNGAGKTTFHDEILRPVTDLPFVNADIIAAELWPGDAAAHAYEAATLASRERQRRIDERLSFVAETVFSHESKLMLIRSAHTAGFQVTLHVVLIPEELAVARVVDRVTNGGHWVPEGKVRERFGRLWTLVRTAIDESDQANVYENTRAAHPFRVVANFSHGRLTGYPDWPTWTPPELIDGRGA